MAITVTGAGGLSMIGGMLILGHIAGYRGPGAGELASGVRETPERSKERFDALA